MIKINLPYKKNISRRVFVKGLVALAALPMIGVSKKTPSYTVNVIGSNYVRGHLLRQPHSGQSVAAYKAKTVIVGGGVSGLAAGYALSQQNDGDYIMLELEDYLGGNSSASKNEVSAFPHAAHYLPLPSKNMPELISFLDSCGVISGKDSSGKPTYREEFLSLAPSERCLANGIWSHGYLPLDQMNRDEHDQLARFNNLVATHAASGEFIIPISKLSKKATYLDTVSAPQYLAEHKINSKHIIKYLNYCCLDDYGTPLEAVSAFGLLHYFAARQPWCSNIDKSAVLTWPEGNGFLVKKLTKMQLGHIRCGATVIKIEHLGKKYRTTFINSGGELQEIESHNLIYAAPTFTLKYVAPSFYPKEFIAQYVPWLVANITVDAWPLRNDQPAWDNIPYDSPDKSLGYVVATHQSLAQQPQNSRTVLTLYLPNVDKGWLLEATPTTLAAKAVAELEFMHPGITKHISDVTLWRSGHAMPRLDINLVSKLTKIARVRAPGFVLAHSDLYGISIFEHAFYGGFLEAIKLRGLL